MILAAGLLVLLGLGLFIAGVVTGVVVLYWACVAACLVAAVLLVLVRRQTGAKAADVPKAPDSGRQPEARETAEPEQTDEPPVTPPPAGAVDEAPSPPEATRAEEAPDPGVEEVEVTDLLVVVDLKDEVLVVDEHPRYHVAECSWLSGRETIGLPLDEARTDGFTPCAVCSPDRTLAERARARKSSGASQPEA